MTTSREPGEQRPLSGGDQDQAEAARRRLDRPPGERYLKSSAPPSAQTPEQGAPARGVAFGVMVAIAGAAVIAVLAAELTVTSGLIIVAAALGWFVQLAIRVGARGTLSARQSRIGALTITLGGVVLGQVGIWLIARSEGGVLGFTDYVGDVFGPLVLVELGVAGVVAWITAR